ncbi:MAG: hypothetical protein ACETVR_00495 [Candidatus Bathyarchaeia archaeon]
MSGPSIGDRLKAALLWFSKKSIEDQMKIISAIPKGDEELRDLLPEEERFHVRTIVLILRGREKDWSMYFLLDVGLNRKVAEALIEAVRETLPPRVENLLNLPLERLRDLMKAGISSYFKRIEPEDKSLEMRSILSYLNRNIRNIDLFYREAGFKRLRNELHNKHFTEKEINALLTPLKTKIEEMANSVYSKLKKPTMPPPAGPDESHFNFIFRHGIKARNELNTFKGTYTADMVIDPFITVSLSLTKEEMDRVYQKMVEINFFDYPDRFSVYAPPWKDIIGVTPHDSYYFKVVYNSKIKELFWEAENIVQDENTDKLLELIKLIQDIIYSKEEFKKLPKRRAGYM